MVRVAISDHDATVCAYIVDAGKYAVSQWGQVSGFSAVNSVSNDIRRALAHTDDRRAIRSNRGDEGIFFAGAPR